jgi:hypothetical protein
VRSVPILVVASLCLFANLAFADPLPDKATLYERIICVVPLTGSGTLNDPRRPLFAPGPVPDTATASTPGFVDPAAIVAFQSVLSDDGQFAIVQFVARDRAAFKQILAANRGTVQFFESDKVLTADLLTALRQYKQNFTLDSLKAGVQ